jgi:hypothetical protein
LNLTTPTQLPIDTTEPEPTDIRFLVNPSSFVINRYSLPKQFNTGKKHHPKSENEEAFMERKRIYD